MKDSSKGFTGKRDGADLRGTKGVVLDVGEHLRIVRVGFGRVVTHVPAQEVYTQEGESES